MEHRPREKRRSAGALGWEGSTLVRPVPRRAENYEAGCVIVGDGVPNVTATDAPPFVAVPGLRSHFEGFGFEFFRGIAGDGPEAPDLIASLGVISNKRAADAVVGTVVANQDAAFGDVRRAGDSGLHGIAHGRFPHFFSGSGIYGDEAAIAGTDENFSVPDSNTAVRACGVRAIDGHVQTNAGIEFPKQLSVGSIDRVNFGLRSVVVSDTVDGDRFGDNAHGAVNVQIPRET